MSAPEAVERPIRFRPVVSADGLAAARMDRNGSYVMYADYVAERDALKAELADAVDFIQHVADGHPKDYSDNTERARAFLARHQKETGV